jgi:hypothetical protein
MSGSYRRQIFNCVTAAFIVSFFWTSFRCLTFCEVYKTKPAGSSHECCAERKSIPTIAALASCPCNQLHNSLEQEPTGIIQGTLRSDQRQIGVNKGTAFVPSSLVPVLSAPMGDSALPKFILIQERYPSLHLFLLTGVLLI